MKGITEKIMIIALIVGISACKEISVGLDDEAQDALDCITSSGCEDEESDDGDEVFVGDLEDEDEDDEGSGNNGNGNSHNSSDDYVDTGDSTGGVEILPTGRKGSSRFFMGTYEINEYDYDDCGDSYWGNGYDLPGVIRAYSHGDKIDFEDNFGNLRWIATVYPDDTFDYNMQFLDSFGNPSNIVACTCYIEEPYSYSYDSDTMKCTCDPMAAEDKTCSITYDMM